MDKKRKRIIIFLWALFILLVVLMPYLTTRLYDNSLKRLEPTQEEWVRDCMNKEHIIEGFNTSTSFKFSKEECEESIDYGKRYAEERYNSLSLTKKIELNYSIGTTMVYWYLWLIPLFIWFMILKMNRNA